MSDGKALLRKLNEKRKDLILKGWSFKELMILFELEFQQ